MSKSPGVNHSAGLSNIKPINNRIQPRKASKPIVLSKIVVVVIVLLLTLVTVSFARIMYGEAVNKFFQIGTGSVELVKYERDLSGNMTNTTISDAEFYLYKLADDPEQSDTQIGGRHITDENGKISVSGLQLGNYYFKETTPAPGWTFDKDDDDAINIYPFTIKLGNTVEVVNAYNTRLTAPLSIVKTVENKDGKPLTAGQRDALFEFTVTFSDGGSHTLSIDGKDQGKLGSGGTLYLKHGQEAVLKNIPVGVLYTVSETPSSHFSVQSTDHQGTMTEGGATASFVNTFDDQPIYLGSLILTLEINDNAVKSSEGEPGEGEGTGTDGGSNPGEGEGEGEGEGAGTDGGSNPGEGEGEGEPGDGSKVGTGTSVNSSLESEANEPGDDTAFDFTVHFTRLPAIPFTITVNGKPVLISPRDNTLELSLKDGEQAVIEGLPEGTTYTATQADYSSQGYMAAPQSFSGQTIQGEIILPFVNFRDVEDEDFGSLLVTKTVINAEEAQSREQKEKQFDITLTFTKVPDGTFEIRIGDEVEELSKDNHEFTFKLKHEESILIEGIPQGVDYDVREIIHSDYTGVIAEATGTISAGHITELGLVNLVHYAPEPPALTSLTITKEVEGRVPEGDEDRTFFFNVSIEGHAPLRIELKAGQSMEFGNLSAGNYYEVTEEDASGAGYVLISVAGGSGTLDEEPNHAVFTNTYTRVITVEISGEKTWDTGIYLVNLPSTITVLLKDGNKTVDVKGVRPDAEGNWKFTFVAPRYNERDEEIAYTIDEVDVPNFSKSAVGYNITNTYVPPAPVAPDPGTQSPEQPALPPSRPGATSPERPESLESPDVPETTKPVEPGAEKPGKELPIIKTSSLKWSFKPSKWDIGFTINWLLIASLIAAGLLGLFLWKRAIILPFAKRRKDEEDELWVSPVALRKLRVAFRKP